jgi:hypothetical protein
MDVPSLDTTARELALMQSFGSAARSLADVQIHFVTRWEAVSDYSTELGRYSTMLGTHAALIDERFLGNPTSLETREREDVIERWLADPDTRSHALAASLWFATYVAALGTALTAFAIKEPGRENASVARTALATADLRLAEHESLERRS